MLKLGFHITSLRLPSFSSWNSLHAAIACGSHAPNANVMDAARNEKVSRTYAAHEGALQAHDRPEQSPQLCQYYIPVAKCRVREFRKVERRFLHWSTPEIEKPQIEISAR
jgi:hypothetical protein